MSISRAKGLVSSQPDYVSKPTDCSNTRTLTYSPTKTTITSIYIYHKISFIVELLYYIKTLNITYPVICYATSS